MSRPVNNNTENTQQKNPNIYHMTHSSVGNRRKYGDNEAEWTGKAEIRQLEARCQQVQHAKL